MKLVLFYLTLSAISGCCLALPFCCHEMFYYSELLLNLRCEFSLCTSNQITSGNICISCAPRTVPLNQNTTGQSALRIAKPDAVCKDYGIDKNVTAGRLVLTWPWFDGKNLSSVFMIEARNFSVEVGKWNFVGVTNETFADVRNLDPEFRYQFRITPAVSPQNVLPLSTTGWISLIELKQDISAPSNMKITEFHVKGNLVEATVEWNASAEVPCSYIISWLPAIGVDYSRQKTVTLPNNSLSAVLSDMAFETNYTVTISPFSFQNLRRSQSAEVWFVTPSCLHLTEGNFSICAPGPPLDIKVQWLSSDSKAVISWLPPAHTSLENEVSNYNIAVAEAYGLLQTIIQYKSIITVKKDSTNITISNLKPSVHYIFEVWAVSEGGRGLPSVVDLNTKDLKNIIKESGMDNANEIPYFYITIPLVLVFIIISILVIRFRFFKKRPKNQGFPSGLADVDDDMRKCLIQSDKIQLREMIGQGAFATVYRGIYTRNKSKEDVAVKVFPAETVTRRNMLHEVDLLQLIGRHDNIVGFVGFTLDVDKMCLLFEYCKLGNLHIHLIGLKPELMLMKSLPSSERPNYAVEKNHGMRLCTYIYQVARGMEYISSLKLIHRDIAARNILLYDERRVKIGDFGLSRDVYETRNYASQTQKTLPIKWMAPESIERQRFNIFTDVWSFGVFMWEVFKLGKEPYPGLHCSNMLQYLKMGYRLEKPHCLQEWYDIMYACWNINPRERPVFKELVERIGALIGLARLYTILD